ncbi:hypothetical protein [uncultured Massilia sp.]|uniref:hypothetical protein n=1 Tax=uncultured Massilia sp. TaxID=169973 RepID=UPI002589678F|nr:hypothetical protein [uncultured Massilia sp.]
MGYEYRVRTAAITPELADRILRNAGGGAASRIADGYEYREAGSAGVPAASARIEPEGFYVCMSGAHGLAAEVIGYIVAACAAYGSVIVNEID